MPHSHPSDHDTHRRLNEIAKHDAGRSSVILGGSIDNSLEKSSVALTEDAQHFVSREHVIDAIARLQAAVQEHDESIQVYASDPHTAALIHFVFTCRPPHEQALLRKQGSQVNEYWGYMSRAGFADKSHLMRQIEKYADIYTSRVSNLLVYTPYKHFLSPRQVLLVRVETPQRGGCSSSHTTRCLNFRALCAQSLSHDHDGLCK